MAKIGIAAQLYTARDLLAKDYAGTVQAVAKIGYRNIEMAGYGNLKTAREVAKVHADSGIKVIGNHVGTDAAEEEPERSVRRQRDGRQQDADRPLAG